ncbi:MAG: tRNA uridine-5-carboxymethylaminomethyl(34) synthesis enzyme MnmG [Candidatus Marinimicrobia bacterium]|nr:tRNA uridine-5-carboxymethylaminomethyl(34) synthesis enzyme MnmG [Candidatus Neomarinimicrobiota bacterium]
MLKGDSRTWDIVIAGGGHAGIEAALATARMGCSTLLVTMDPAAVGRMSCNPAIGGLAKGHLVREIDALGGEMGLAADQTGLQFKILNTSKGRAVWSPRAQIDKRAYSDRMASKIANQANLMVMPGEVTKIIAPGGQIRGAVIDNSEEINARAIIITCGTFMNGLIHIGDRQHRAGRMGERPAHGITESLRALGFRTGRLKTGTPPRLRRDSINWDKVTENSGDQHPRPFSFRTAQPFTPLNMPCHITHTNERVHEIIHGSLDRAPLFTGQIAGVGPRYCPSIEDKIVRFAQRNQHQIFLEPEWRDSHQIYTNGFATSLPEEIQVSAIRQIKGLERARFIRPGYAIEYDFVPPSQLKATLETKAIDGLFLAGQVNGTSGYEEAGAQGLVAGINAAAQLLELDELQLHRDQSYIGVLIDDLITKDTDEPYRMFTSRAEYRLLLRPDNADLRLSEIGLAYGLLDGRDRQRIAARQKSTRAIRTYCENTSVRINGELGEALGRIPEDRISLQQLLKNPGISLAETRHLLPKELDKWTAEDLFTAETDIKYAGYIKRQLEAARNMRQLDSAVIDHDFDINTITAMRTESREKLALVKPQTLGQASRISGVNPPDVALLSLHLKRWRVSRETSS